MRKLSLTVNGERHDIDAEDSATLLDVLRLKLFLTGTKSNCLEAECGVCTVLIDGRAINSCITLAAQCEGADIRTIEGMADGDKLHALQQSFIECDAVQCGYCIPGMIMTAAGLLNEKPNPSFEEIQEGLCGTLCRCTGYTKIVQAVQHAAQDGRVRQ
ncbi:(2Fe-2S)-binding protein [Ferrovibrio sp.]|uniref:(2Fe-2S)-binding protein n=1 Tax=Ferrovibrio sp. TaxID=1917215 RepID=UPI0035AE712C